MWAIERGGRSVYDAARAAFDEILARHRDNASCDRDDPIDPVLCDHGRASAVTVRRAAWIVAHQIVAPIASALEHVAREPRRAAASQNVLITS